MSDSSTLQAVTSNYSGSSQGISGGLSSGNSTSSSVGYMQGTLTIPQTGTITTPNYTWYNYSNPFAIYDIQIQKAENGYIVYKGGKTYLCLKAEDIVEFIKL